MDPGSVSRRGVLRLTAGAGAGGAVLSAGGTLTATAESTGVDEFSWPTLLGGEQRTGTATLDPITSVAETAYSLGGTDRISAPVVDDGTVYAGSDDALVATDLVSGTGVWAYRADDAFIASPAVGPDSVVGVTTDGAVVSVDRDDGEERWSLGVSGQPGAPIVDDGTVYVADSEGTVYAFEASTGELTWSASLEARFSTNGSNAPGLMLPTVAVGDDALYVNVPNRQVPPSRLVALSFDGEVEWEYAIDAGVLSPPAVTDQGIVVKADRHLRLVSATGGVERWATELRVDANHPLAVGNGRIALLDDGLDDPVRCAVYDPDSGELAWEYTIEGGRRTGGATIVDDVVYVVASTGSRTGQFVALGLDDGLERFSLDIDAPDIAYGPVPVPNGLFVPDGTASRLVVSEAFEDESGSADADGGSDSTSSDDDSGTGGDDGTAGDTDGTDGTDDGGTGDDGTGDDGTTDDDESGWGLPSLSVIESIVVIVTTLASAAYGAIRVAARSATDD